MGTLQRAAEGDIAGMHSITLGCAFNPHIGGTLDPDHDGPRSREEEFQRLRAKLDTGVVSHIWLQFGADTASLEDRLTRLQEELHARDQGHVRIIGSVFIPTKAWLNKMRFRCWSGCFLGPKDDGEYLSSLEGATEVTRRIMQIYRRFGVEAIVESSVRSKRELEECAGFLESTITDAPDNSNSTGGRRTRAKHTKLEKSREK